MGTGRYILAIDQGTTGSTALLLSEDLRVRGMGSIDFPQYFPEPQWVEHDLDEIWKSVTTAVELALKQAAISPREIVAIGITNQRETTCLWRKSKRGEPFGRAIVWQDRRTASQCERLRRKGLEAKIQKKTGLLLDPYFSATKLQWMLEHREGALELAKRGELAFGTIDSFLLYRMTQEHRTDVSNASRTLLMNLKRCTWDSDLVELFDIPKAILPEIFPSAVEYGKTKSFMSLPDGIPVAGIAGDQQAALFGQACFEAGDAKCTYGTGAFALVNTGTKPVFSKHRLLTSVGWKLGKETTYVLEGSAFVAGAAVQWMRDGLELIPSSEAIEKLAATVPNSDGVLFIPALTGLGAPYWVPGATGLISGITRRTTRGHLARATLEGIAYQVADLMETMQKDMKNPIQLLRVDGGASANGILMQFQADVLGQSLVRAKSLETTALGAALQAGLAVNLFPSLEAIRRSWQAAEKFEPKLDKKTREERLKRWRQTVLAAKALARPTAR